MKAIKLTIIAVLVAALGFVIYNIMNPNDPSIGGQGGGDIEIPDGCDLEWAQQYIDSVYRTIPDGQFQTLKERRVEMQSNFNEMMEGEPKKCQETVDLMLRNRYQSRFVKMANNEFAGKDWPNYSDIKDMNAALLVELSQGSQELKKIESICKEYGQIVSYNSQVKKQRNQRPSTLSDHWDLANAKDLISNTPSASTPVDHTTQYELSRTGNVKNLLYDGHVAFLEKMGSIAYAEIQRKRTKIYYNQVCEIVAKEIEQFKNNATSVYGKSQSVVTAKAKELNDTMDSYENLLDKQ